MENITKKYEGRLFCHIKMHCLRTHGCCKKLLRGPQALLGCVTSCDHSRKFSCLLSTAWVAEVRCASVPGGNKPDRTQMGTTQITGPLLSSADMPRGLFCAQPCAGLRKSWGKRLLQNSAVTAVIEGTLAGTAPVPSGLYRPSALSQWG